MKSLNDVHARAENDQRLGVFPAHDDVVRPHAVGDIVAAERGGVGQPLRRAAFGRHDVDLGVAVVLRSEGELLAVGREARERSVAGTARQAARHSALFGDGVKLARVTEDDLAAVGGGKTQEPRGVRQLLRERGAERQGEKREQAND